jgi:hypothetical protein
MPPTIRPSNSGDLPALIDLMFGYFDFYEVVRPERAKLEKHLQLLWDDPSRGAQFGAQCAGELLGFATLYATLETLATAPILVMNDLFVVPSEHGARIGEALISSCS